MWLTQVGQMLDMRHLYAPNQHLDDQCLASVLSPAVVKALSTKSMQSMLRGLFAHYAGSASTGISKGNTGRRGKQSTLAATGSSNGSSIGRSTTALQEVVSIDKVSGNAYVILQTVLCSNGGCQCMQTCGITCPSISALPVLQSLDQLTDSMHHNPTDICYLQCCFYPLA